jgi:hypothetical protein
MSQKQHRKKREIGRRHKRKCVHVVSKSFVQHHDSDEPFQVILEAAKTLNSNWYVSRSEKQIRLFIIAHTDQQDQEPTKIIKSLLIKNNLEWVLYVHGVKANKSSLLSSIPSVLTTDSFKELISIVYGSKICSGIINEKYVDMCRRRKGKFCSIKKDVFAFLEEGYPVAYGERNVYQCHSALPRL